MNPAGPDQPEDPMDRMVARCGGCGAVFVVGRRDDGELYPLGRDGSCCGDPELVSLNE